MKIAKLRLLSLTIFIAIAVNFLSMTLASENKSAISDINSLLSDPFLQLPTENTVNVVWFTEFAGDRHLVKYGKQLQQRVTANTTKLSRVREDRDSQINNPPPKSQRDIWRHEAVVTNLTPNQRVPYQVTSLRNSEAIASDVFTLTSLPPAETPLKILLTSDHQLMPMTTANLAQVVETVGRVDAVFLPGDLVNIPDRASEWFDDLSGGAFFPALQGRGNYQLERNGITTTYRGGEIIQHAPLFTAVGNHEVMGKVAADSTLKQEFSQPQPRWVAQKYYDSKAIAPAENSPTKAEWIKNHSFNTDTYEEIFTQPKSDPGGKRYYAVTFGDVRLISLYVTNIWRSPSLEPEAMGRYKESDTEINNPQAWVCGGNDISKLSDPNNHIPNFDECRIYKPIWRVILDWFKSMSSTN